MIEPDVAWSDPAPDRPIPLLAALCDDLRAHLPAERRGGPLPLRVVRALAIAVRSSGFHAGLVYRLAHTLRGRFGPPGRLAASLLSSCMRRLYNCEIDPASRLHGGLILPHPQGIVVEAGTAVGPRAWIFQNAAIGSAPGRSGVPRVGSDARIFAGAVLTGPVVVGDHVAVGANAIVHRDVPARSIVRPSPVEFIPRNTPAGGRLVS